MIGKVSEVMSAAIVAGATSSFDTGASGAESVAVNESAKAAAETQTAKQSDPQVVAAQAQQEKRKKDAEEQKMDEASVSFMTEELNELMSRINCNLQFNYHKDVDVMSVKMLDKATGEVLKEFPPEEMIKNMQAAREWIGAFLDRNA